MGSVCSDDKVKRDFDLLVSRLKSFLFGSGDFKPGSLPPQIGASELVVEEELHIRHGLELVQKDFVKTSSICCIICLLESKNSR